MSITVKRITSKTVILTDGRRANLVVFAYHPEADRVFRRAGQTNDQRFVRSGCPASNRMVREGRFTGLVVIGRETRRTDAGRPVYEAYPGAEVYEMLKTDENGYRLPGSFYDDCFGNPKYMREVPGVRAPGTGPVLMGG